ncbi:hypothetical protein BOTBODRAFT_100515 [Botryobasidium botryosum FD-172 SS1]|uniref:PRELI/MSF1 domain-containing protein n=1 Tax=Botryobasidium botryosum (strain FD-172 SS1) TaxID=930990 RepID=A0A067N9G6_BOTB1|nr:hypothetical protein BOTBODRAFT_100515 [Botryobasidium botryosum FD-172 SS1]
MVKFFAQSHVYDDPWATVTLAFFLRYPNPYASHVVSCDVISRTPTPYGTLLTQRLLLKRGSLPKWAPQGIMTRTESWILEESEVDVEGRIVRCKTSNIDHVKVMQVHESTVLKEDQNGKTVQTTEARFVSNFGWGLTKRLEKFAQTKFVSNIEKSREGISLILRLLRESRLQPLPIAADGYPGATLNPNAAIHIASASTPENTRPDSEEKNARLRSGPGMPSRWQQIRSWFTRPG